MALSVQHFPAVLFLPLTLLLSACDSGDTPADIREVARQGAYSMNFSASAIILALNAPHSPRSPVITTSSMVLTGLTASMGWAERSARLAREAITWSIFSA